MEYVAICADETQFLCLVPQFLVIINSQIVEGGSYHFRQHCRRKVAFLAGQEVIDDLFEHCNQRGLVEFALLVELPPMVHQHIKVFLPLKLQDVLVEERKRYSQHSERNLALHYNTNQFQQPEQGSFHIIFK